MIAAGSAPPAVDGGAADGGAGARGVPPDLAALEHALRTEEGDFANQLAKGPAPGQAAVRSHLPVMPGALTPLTDISDGMVMYGVPMNLATFETEASAREVLHFYAEYFQRQGWDFSGPKENAEVVPYPALSAASGPEGLQLSVMVMGREPKGSTVILGLADMNAVKAKGANAWKDRQLDDLPLYPKSDPAVLVSTDRELRSVTVSFDTPDPREGVAAFFRKEMQARGYTENPDPLPSSESLTHLQFVKPGHAWTLALSPWQGRTFVTAQEAAEAPP